MKLSDTTALANFISTHGHAWKAFEFHTGLDLGLESARVSGFSFDQNNGSFVLKLGDTPYFFRLYRDAIIALHGPGLAVVFVGGEAVTCPC